MAASCRQAALRFLKIRPRSVGDLKAKLAIKGFDAQQIKETLQWLTKTQLLDDRSFTKSWIQYRLARPFGFRRIIAELKAKGIDQALIEEAIQAFKQETDEPATALGVAKRRWQRLEGIELQKKKKHIYDFLIRRGFGMDVVMKVLKQL